MTLRRECDATSEAVGPNRDRRCDLDNGVELLGRYSKLPALPKLEHITTQSRSARAPSRVHRVERRLSPEIIAQLVGDYEAGEPTTALMIKYGLGKGSVLGLLRAAGVEMRAQGQKNIDLPEAFARYQSGWSLAKLAIAYDCSAETVRQALKAAGVVLRPRNGWSAGTSQILATGRAFSE